MANVNLKCRDFVSNIADRLELCEALLRQREQLATTGLYSAKRELNYEACDFVGEQLDSLVNSMRLFVEDLQNEQERVNATV